MPVDPAENVRRLFNESRPYIEKPNDVLIKYLPKEKGEKILLEQLARESKDEVGNGRKFRIITLCKDNSDLLKVAMKNFPNAYPEIWERLSLD